MSVRDKVIEAYDRRVKSRETLRGLLGDFRQLIKIEFLKKSIEDYLGLEVGFSAERYNIEDMVFTVFESPTKKLLLLMETENCQSCGKNTQQIIESIADIGEGLINPILSCFNPVCESYEYGASE